VRRGRIPAQEGENSCLLLAAICKKAFEQRSWLSLGAVLLNTVPDNKNKSLYFTV